MGKTTKYPAYSDGAVRINGQTKATSQKVGNSVVSNYNMSDTEKNIYDSVLNNMDSSLANLFSVSDPQRKVWNEQLDVMKRQGINHINNIYTPMQENLKNDIASRFGNLDNSSFLNNLKKITDNKASAIAQLSNNLALTQNDLYSNELQTRMNMINFLNGLNNSFNNNMLSYMGMANQNSSAGNSYNQTAYNNNSKNNMLDQYLNMQKQLSQTAMQIAPLFL